MKKFILFMTILSVLLLTACDVRNFGWGTLYIKDVDEYGKFGRKVSAPDYMPESLEGYTVNDYYYTLYSYFDKCYEIFLDITVNGEQFDTLITEVRAQDSLLYEREAYYAEGYTEIVFKETYKLDEPVKQQEARVGWADIDKVIFNEKTGNIIFVTFHANDTGVYRLEDVAYFNKFGIAQEEYVDHVDLNKKK